MHWTINRRPSFGWGLLVLFMSCLLLRPIASSAAPCPAVPAVVRDIVANSYYSDPQYSIPDPEKFARNRASVKPLTDFLRDIANRASRYAANPAKATPEAECALGWLKTWAEGGAMLGTLSSEQAYYQRKWMLSGLALSYARIRPTADPQTRATIEHWLVTIANLTLDHSDRHKGVRNNHYYWEGIAVAATGAVTGEKRFLDWGQRVFDRAMADVAADGSLPHELARGRKALKYHLFAAAPLAMLASVLDRHSPRMDALVAYCLKGIADPASVAATAGTEQEGPINDNEVAWLQISLRQHHDPAVAAFVAGRKSAATPNLGGNLLIANPLEHPAGR